MIAASFVAAAPGVLCFRRSIYLGREETAGLGLREEEEMTQGMYVVNWRTREERRRERKELWSNLRTSSSGRSVGKEQIKE